MFFFHVLIKAMSSFPNLHARHTSIWIFIFYECDQCFGSKLQFFLTHSLDPELVNPEMLAFFRTFFTLQNLSQFSLYSGQFDLHFLHFLSTKILESEQFVYFIFQWKFHFSKSKVSKFRNVFRIWARALKIHGIWLVRYFVLLIPRVLKNRQGKQKQLKKPAKSQRSISVLALGGYFLNFELSGVWTEFYREIFQNDCHISS